MAEKIIFKYENIGTAVTSIKKIAEDYEEAGKTLITELNAATASWEGASKDKFDTLINTGAKSVKEYVEITIPTVIKGLSEMLESNAAQMKGADDKIAGQLSDSL